MTGCILRRMEFEVNLRKSERGIWGRKRGRCSRKRKQQAVYKTMKALR